MAFSSTNPFAPKEKPASSAGVPSVTTKQNGTPSPQPNKITTQKTFSTSNPFAGSSTTVTKENMFKPSSSKPIGGGGGGSWGAEVKTETTKKIVVKKKESFWDSLKRLAPGFAEGFTAPFTSIPSLVKQTATSGESGKEILRRGLVGGIGNIFTQITSPVIARLTGQKTSAVSERAAQEAVDLVTPHFITKKDGSISLGFRTQEPFEESARSVFADKNFPIALRYASVAGYGALQQTADFVTTIGLTQLSSSVANTLKTAGTGVQQLNEARGVLGVDKSASADEIKQAYRAIAHRTHPDTGITPSTEEFKKATEAYKFLLDNQQRSALTRLMDIFRGRTNAAQEIPTKLLERPGVPSMDETGKLTNKPWMEFLGGAQEQSALQVDMHSPKFSNAVRGIQISPTDSLGSLETRITEALKTAGAPKSAFEDVSAYFRNFERVKYFNLSLQDGIGPIRGLQSLTETPNVAPAVSEISKQLAAIKPQDLLLKGDGTLQTSFATNLISKVATALDDAAGGLGDQLKALIDPHTVENVAEIQQGVNKVLIDNGLIDPPPVKFEGFPQAQAGEGTDLSTASPSTVATVEPTTAPTLTVAEPTQSEAISTARTPETTSLTPSGQPESGQLSIPGVERLGAVSPQSVKPAITEAVRPQADLVTRREDVLLRQRIRAEVRGSKAGFKAGAKLTREVLTDKFRNEVASMEQVRADLAEFIKQELPSESRGKFLDTIKKDLTLRQQFKVLGRVESEKNKLIRKDIIPRLKKMSELTSDTVALKYKKSLNELLGKLDFKKPTKATKRNLNSLKEVLGADEEFAKLHPDLVARVERLTRQPVADLTTVQLKELEDTANMLIERGKLMRDLEVIQNERKLKIATEKFASSTVKVSESGSLKDMSQLEKMKYEARRATYNTLHTSRWARIFDGYKKNGENFKAIKDLSATETYTNDQANIMKEDMFNRMKEIAGDDGEITEEMQIKITAQSLVDQGKISEAQGLLDAHPVEGVKTVEDLDLTETEQQLLQLGRDVIKENLEAKTVATYEMLENEIFPKVENYTPIFYEGEDNLLASDIVERQKFSRRNVEQGFTKERQQNVDKVPRHDFFGMISDHIDSALWYINLQPKLKVLARVTQSEEYLNAGGTLAVEQWRKLIDVVARRGYSANYQASWWLKKLRINLSQSQLGFRVTSIVSQPFAVFDGMAVAQTNWGIKATAEVMKEFLQSWIRPGYSGDIVKNSPALNQRQGGELAITESLEGLTETKSWYHNTYRKFVKASFAPLQKADVKTAAGVQQGIQNILEKNHVANAKEEAEFFMNMVSASSNITLRPTILATGDLARLWFTFQTFVMNRWGVIWEDIIKDGVVAGGWQKKMNALTGLAILLGGMVAEEATRRKVKELMGAGNQNQQTLTEYAITAIPSTIPYFGTGFQLFSPFDPSVSPAVLTSAQRVFKGVQSAITGKKDQTKLKGISNAVQGLISLLFGIPASGQVGDTFNNAAFPQGGGSDTLSPDNPFGGGGSKMIIP